MEKDLCKFERKMSETLDIEGIFSKSSITIPHLTETKDFLRQNSSEPYAIPAFVEGNARLMVLRFKKKKKQIEDLMTLLNPELLSSTGLILSEEVQYGVEGTYLVPRHPKIDIMFVRLPGGEAVRQTLVGKSALAFQQAYQALSGLYICDFGLRIDDNEEYQNADDEGKSEIGKAYLQALKDIEEEALKEDKDLADYVKATAFLSEKIEAGVEADKLIEEVKKGEQEDAPTQDNRETCGTAGDKP